MTKAASSAEAASNAEAAEATMPGEQAIVLEREFDAPRELVFRMWTEPEHLVRWWGPRGFTTPHCTVDLRVGGMFHFCMRSPEGRDYWGRGIYREIVKSERLVYIDSFSDEEGGLAEPVDYGIGPDHPVETRVTVTFMEREGRTTVTLRHEMPASVPERTGTEQGWSEMLDRLAQQIVTG